MVSDIVPVKEEPLDDYSVASEDNILVEPQTLQWNSNASIQLKVIISHYESLD